MMSVADFLGMEVDVMLENFGIEHYAVFKNDSTRGHVELPKLGLSFSVENTRLISTIHFYSEGLDGYSEFSGVLPKGLNFLMSRDEVHEVLGFPTKAIESHNNPFMGEMKARDFFEWTGKKIKIEYWIDTNKIALLSLS